MRDTSVSAFVLLSGGIDSATALYYALNDFRQVQAVSIDYGQRHRRELQSAAAVAQRASVEHSILTLPTLLCEAGGMLTDKAVAIPDISYDKIEGISPTFVPFRNGTMLSILAAHAMKYVNHVQRTCNLSRNSDLLKDLVTLYFGAHAEDARNWAYPDCTPEFVGAMANAIYIGSYQTVRLRAPFIYSTKAEIVAEGKRFGVPYDLTWSCYAGGDVHCGTCPTCRARKHAFRDAGTPDPTIYAA